jgi:hypothetical protein
MGEVGEEVGEAGMVLPAQVVVVVEVSQVVGKVVARMDQGAGTRVVEEEVGEVVVGMLEALQQQTLALHTPGEAAVRH